MALFSEMRCKQDGLQARLGADIVAIGNTRQFDI